MTILLLGDLTGRSRVALRMLTGELENRGHEVLALPTALISNTLNLGRAAIADTTDYLLEALETWEALGLSYDLLYIGYVTGLAQAEKLCRVADAARARGVPVVVDPILGDHGRRYNSVSVEQAEAMARLIRHADIITPNLTEACLMTGQPYENADVDALLDALGGAETSVLVTSAGDAVAGKDARTGRRFRVPFRRIPGEHWGTGDRFCALLLDALAGGLPLEQAAKRASVHGARDLRQHRLPRAEQPHHRRGSRPCLRPRPAGGGRSKPHFCTQGL